MSAADHLYKRYRLPSGKLVEVRRITEGNRPEVVVREVNDDNELCPGEFDLRLDFVLQHAKAVPHV